ncbi:MAG: hypothetical protein ACRDIL_01135 [Candidatus Limnocylindrales bacterium]
MSGQVSTILEPLADAIDALDLPIDGTVLTEASALADRLNAKLLAAVGEHDAAEQWRNDATSPAGPSTKVSLSTFGSTCATVSTTTRPARRSLTDH